MHIHRLNAASPKQKAPKIPDTIMNSEADLLSYYLISYWLLFYLVIPVAISVQRSELLNLTQCDIETVRSFFARIRGLAITCKYSLACDECARKVDFTNVIAKDI